MRIIDAEAQVLNDLKDEGRVVAEQTYGDFTVITVRHPTLGKLVLVRGRDGSGAMVEADE
jgi:hypothetical protein